MHRKFLEHLEQTARSAGYEPMKNCATFKLASSKNAKGILPGAVYGLAVILNDEDARALEAEAAARGSLKTPLRSIRLLPLGDSAAIPLYWGKDAAVGYRLYRHLLDQNPKKGCLGGRFYATLFNKDILAASVPVCDFVAFEKYIERAYPPLLFNVNSTNISNFTHLAT